MGSIVNLINETYNYVRGGVYIYGTPRVSNNYPLVETATFNARRWCGYVHSTKATA